MQTRPLAALGLFALLLSASVLAATLPGLTPFAPSASQSATSTAAGSAGHSLLPKFAAGAKPLVPSTTTLASGAGNVVAGGVGADAATFKLSDSHSTGSELNLGVSRQGTIYVGGWNHVARSKDDGATWTALNPEPIISVAADRVLVVDHQTSRVYVEDTTLACGLVDYSDDEGASWLNSPVACGGGVTDHAKIAVGKRTTYADPTGLLYPNVLYMCANGLATANCGVSVDGGLLYLPTVPHGIGCAFQGTPMADARGTLYEPTSSCGAKVRKTADNGITWIETPVTGANPSPDTPDLAITPDGTVYFFFTTTTWQPAFSRSSDGGRTWQGPFVVPVAGLTSSVFPVITAGDDGRIGLAFYGTTDDKSGWDHNPGSAPDTIRWNAYVAVVTDAASPAPTIAPVQLTTNSDPLQYGCLSKMGGCLDNIADYMDIDVGADGRVYAVFVDGCPSTCTGRASSTASEGIVAIQTGGPNLKA